MTYSQIVEILSHFKEALKALKDCSTYFFISLLCVLIHNCRLSTQGFRECDKMDGASNFIPWNLRL